MPAAASGRHPTPVVVALIQRGDTVLLAQRWSPENPAAHGRYELPGGKVEHGDHPMHAVEREIAEELGVTFTIQRVVPHVHSTIWRMAGGETDHALLVAFAGTIPNDAVPRPRVSAITCCVWTRIQTLATHPSLMPGTLEFIEAWAGMRCDRFPRASPVPLHA